MKAAEFFAGIGLVRMGLERSGIDVAWSNDIEPFKQTMYQAQFGADQGHKFHLGDVAEVSAADLPDDLDLAWASFPCTDLSLAGDRAGLHGSESGTFWHFTRILDEMGEARPRVVALENVIGLATSHGGDDLAAAVRELNRLSYSVDVLTLDARRFVPQSRPRLFIIGAQDVPERLSVEVNELRPDWLQGVFSDPTLVTHQADIPAPPPLLSEGMTSLAQRMPANHHAWWDFERTRKFLDSLSPIQVDRLETLKSQRTISYRTAYRRTRNGSPVWEIRADDVSGCLRTARGGSSKQAVVQAGRGRVKVRWMTPKEYAVLMGAADYNIDGQRDSQVLFGFGDAVCVPVVTWLADNYLAPLAAGTLTIKPARLKVV